MDVVDVLPRDAIRSIDAPAFGPDHFGDPGDEVVVVDADPPRAYPVRILSHHEIVNDLIERDDRTPIAVTWCPICGSAAVYDRRVDGRVLDFGVSGKLADDALVLYDRETDTEWQQTTGEAIDGELAGTTLRVVPAGLSTWGDFRAAHPEGLVLQPAVDGDPRTEYRTGSYDAYERRETFGLYGMRGTGEPREWHRTDLDAKTVVLGIEHGGEAVGYPRPRVVRAGGVLADTVGGRGVVVVTVDGRLHAFADPGIDLVVREDRLEGDGTTWDVTTGESGDGRRLDRVPARRMYAFAWQDAHGPASFYG
jgi:hypothetical protein